MPEDVAYYLIDGQPVKWRPAMAGGSVTLGWDAASQQFVADSAHVERLLAQDAGVVAMDAAAFAAALAAIRHDRPVIRRAPHAARGVVLESLRPWAHSREPIADTLRGLTEDGWHWFILGVEPAGDPGRTGQAGAVLVESRSLAVAVIAGDGTHFGAVTVPAAAELAEIVTRYRLTPF